MKLTRRLLQDSIFPAIVVLLAGFSISAVVVAAATSRYQKQELVYHGDMACQRLASYIEKYDLMLEEAACNSAVEDYLKTLEDGKDYKENPHYGEVSRILDSAMDSGIGGGAAAFWLVDYDAQIFLESSGSGVLKNLPGDHWKCEDRVWYEDSLEASGSFFSKAYVAPWTGKVVSSIVFPIRDRDTGLALGALGVDMEVDRLGEIIGEQAGESLLMVVNQEGLILYHRDKDEVLQKCRELEYYESIERKLWAGRGGTCQFLVKEEKMVGAISRVGKAGWMAISAAPASKLYQSVGKAVVPILCACLLSIAVITGLNYAFARRAIIEPLEEIGKAAESIAHQNSDYELSIQSQDEIGAIAHVLNTNVKWLFRELKEKNQRIGESMEYARMFQQKIFPSEEAFQAAFQEYGVLHSSRESLGGDFIWNFQGGDGSLWIIGDCTGHGISGALFSAVTTVMLGGIVTKQNCSDLKAILLELDKQLYKLTQYDSGYREIYGAPGLDMAMVFLSSKGGMDFLGGNLDLYIEENGQVQKIRGHKLPIGNGSLEETKRILPSQAGCRQNASYFIATDGFFEQPGGEKGIPYGYSRFKKAFGAGYGKKAGERMEDIKRAWLEYKGANRQRDDVTALCFQIKG